MLSMNTGSRFDTIGLAVAEKVRDWQKLRRLFLAAFSAIWMAAVPEESAAACFAPTQAASSFQRRPRLVKGAIQLVSRLLSRIAFRSLHRSCAVTKAIFFCNFIPRFLRSYFKVPHFRLPQKLIFLLLCREYRDTREL